MRSLAILCFLVLATSTKAAEPWTPREKVLEGIYLTLHVIDWRQTHYATDHPDEFFEHNLLLGRYPSRGEVNTYFVAAGVGHILIVNALSHRWREPVQWASILVVSYVIHHNHQLGVRFTF